MAISHRSEVNGRNESRLKLREKADAEGAELGAGHDESPRLGVAVGIACNSARFVGAGVDAAFTLASAARAPVGVPIARIGVLVVVRHGLLSPQDNLFFCLPAREIDSDRSGGVPRISGEIREPATASEILGTKPRRELR